MLPLKVSPSKLTGLIFNPTSVVVPLEIVFPIDVLLGCELAWLNFHVVHPHVRNSRPKWEWYHFVVGSQWIWCRTQWTVFCVTGACKPRVVSAASMVTVCQWLWGVPSGTCSPLGARP